MCVDVRNELFARFALCTSRIRYNQIDKVHVKQMENSLTNDTWAWAVAICMDEERNTF